MIIFAWLSLITADAAAPQWKNQGQSEGVTIESRPMKGSSFDELRLTAKSPRKPTELCRAAWGDGALKKAEPGFIARQVLKESENERWTYEQISTPIVSNRDYTMHAKRVSDATTGICQVLFDTRNQDGPPVANGFVRIPRISGSWTLEPEGDGTLITYLIYSEPGGNIAAWMAKGGQKSSAVKWMKTILARADTTTATTKQ